MTATDDDLPPYELALDYVNIGGDPTPGRAEVRGAYREWEWSELAGWGLDGASLILVRRRLAEFDVEFTIVTQAQLTAWDSFYEKWLKTPVARGRTTAPNDSAARARLAYANQQLATAKTLSAAKGLSDQQQQTFAAQAANASAQASAAQAVLDQLPPAKGTSRGIGIYHPRLARVGICAVVVKRVSQFTPTPKGAEVVVVSFKEYRAPKFILTKPNGSIPGVGTPTPKPKDAIDEAIDTETKRMRALSNADAAEGAIVGT